MVRTEKSKDDGPTLVEDYRKTSLYESVYRKDKYFVNLHEDVLCIYKQRSFATSSLNIYHHSEYLLPY